MAGPRQSPKASIARMSDSQPLLNDVLIPLCLGVTGHRDIPIEDLPVLEVAIRHQLAELDANYPSSPKLLLTGLAEGADRLVARCALAAGWAIGAVLPLPPDEYETDFADDASIAEFRDLLQHCAWVRVLDTPSLPRPDCYAVLSDYLSRHAIVLLALWDGEASTAAGGTCETIRLFREGAREVSVVPPESGPVIHIVTRRQRDMVTPRSVGKTHWIDPCPAGLPSEGEKLRWQTVMARLDGFNRDARSQFDSLSGQLLQAKEWLFDGQSCNDIPDSAARAAWVHALADRLSFTAQETRSRRMQQIFCLALLAITFETWYGTLSPQPWLLLIAIVCGGGAYGVYRLMARDRLEERYLDYRMLAEACRVQTFWKLSAMPDCTADHCLREQRDEVEWIRQALLTLELGPNQPGKVTVNNLRLSRDAWIEGQRRWFVKDQSPGKNSDLAQRWGRRVSRLAWAGLAALLLLLTVHIATSENDALITGLAAAYSLLFACAGFAKVYLEIKTYAEQASRYRQMALVMTIARSRIDESLAAGDLDRTQAFLRAAGKEALEECTGWLLLHRERPVSVPLGG